MQQSPVLLFDNGASSVKAGIAGSGLTQNPRIITNAVIRQTKGDKETFIGHELDECTDFASLHFRRPFERGLLTDWDAQKAVWDGIVSQDCLDVCTSEASILVTEPYFNLPNVQEQYDQIIFEAYDFQAYARCIPASLIPYGSLFSSQKCPSVPECMVIVDSGFSYTHVLPLLEGKVIWPGVHRIDLGGKLLTNYLKELLSYRQFDLMGETYVVNDVKEKCCFVSTNYKQDMELSRSNPSDIVEEYVLPRFSDRLPGRVKAHDEMTNVDDDIVKMSTERFSIPELLFKPSDIGKCLSQAGLAHTIANAISATPDDLHGLFWANIGLIGGNVMFPGFKQRLYAELRSLASAEYQVGLYEASNAITAAYNAGAPFVSQPGFANLAVTRAEYQESGSSATKRKFVGMSWMHDRDNSSRLNDHEITKMVPSAATPTEGQPGDGRARSKPSRSGDGSGGGGENKSTRSSRKK